MANQPRLDADLFDAVRNDNQTRVDQLLKAGANIEATEEEGTTPLHIAASLGYMEMVKFLIARGANINATNNRGGTSLFMARAGYTFEQKFGNSTSASQRLELIKWLQEHGAVDAPGSKLFFPLFRFTTWVRELGTVDAPDINRGGSFSSFEYDNNGFVID